MYNRWRKKEKKTHWEYETVILVNTEHAFYYIGEFAHSMEKIVDQTIETLREWHHRIPELKSAYFFPKNTEEKIDISAKINDLCKDWHKEWLPEIPKPTEPFAKEYNLKNWFKECEFCQKL
jgi:hypothetical protein